MDNSGSIVEFFYNIVPGSLFLLSLKYFGGDIFVILGSKPDPVFFVFIYIILGLFLGFLFQGITKLVRDMGWNKEMAKKVAEKDENRDCFEQSYKMIHNLKNYKSPKEFRPTFYLMDCCLRGIKAAFLPTHFSSRFAFWSNILFASIFLGLLSPMLIFVDPHLIHKIPGLVILLVMILISMVLTYKHFSGFYDAILKTYFMLVVKNHHASDENISHVSS